MYQRTAYRRWLAALNRVLPVFADMRTDERLPEKLVAHAVKNPKLVMLGDIIGSYVCEQCGADEYRAGTQSLSLKFDEMVVDVCLPDEVIDLIEKVLMTMVHTSITKFIRQAEGGHKAA